MKSVLAVFKVTNFWVVFKVCNLGIKKIKNNFFAQQVEM
jgi:hypothetical protein